MVLGFITEAVDDYIIEPVTGSENGVFGEGGLLDTATGGSQVDAEDVAKTGEAFSQMKYDPNVTNFNVPGYQASKDKLAQMQSAYMNKAAPTSEAASMTAAQGTNATIATGPQDQMRQDQQSLINALQNPGTSAAQMQLQRGKDAAIAASRAQAASARGVSAGAANKMAAQGIASATAAAGADSAILRAQEDAQRQALLGNVLQGARGQDIGLATDQAGLEQQTNMQNAGFQQQASQTNAGFQQQTNLANQQANLDQQKLNNDMVQHFLSLGFSYDQAQMQAQIALEQLNADQATAAMNATAGIVSQNAANQQAAVGGMMSAGGTLGAAAMMSDERVKRNIKPLKGRDALVDALNERARTMMNEDEAADFKGYRAGKMTKAQLAEADERALALMNTREADEFLLERRKLDRQVGGQRKARAKQQDPVLAALLEKQKKMNAARDSLQYLVQYSPVLSSAKGMIPMSALEKLGLSAEADPKLGNPYGIDPNDPAMTPEQRELLGLPPKETVSDAGAKTNIVPLKPPSIDAPAFRPEATTAKDGRSLRLTMPDRETMQARKADYADKLAKEGASDAALGTALMKGFQAYGAAMSKPAEQAAERNRQRFLSYSDVGLKTNTAPVGSDVQLKQNASVDHDKLGEFLATLQPYEYEYRDPARHGAGTRYGIMAQDAAASDVGRTFVKDTPDGLALDARDALGPILASLAYLDERTRALEGGA